MIGITPRLVGPLLIPILLAACGGIALSPLTFEHRTVSPVANQTRTITLAQPMVWYDRLIDHTRGILFPEGTYVMEAEDENYRYFHAPGPLEYRIFDGDKVTGDRFIAGGIFLNKASLVLVPAGAYLTNDDKNKTLTWKLGREFMRMEGSKWEKNF